MAKKTTTVFRQLTREERISFILMTALLLLIGLLHMATLVLTAMFCYLAMRVFSCGGSKWLGLTIFTVVLVGTSWGLYVFGKQAVVAFPKLAETTIPAIARFAETNSFDLPFTDYPSLKAVVLDEAKERMGNVGGFARTLVTQIVYLIIGIVIAVSLFLNAQFRMEGDPHTASDNLYTLTAHELIERFTTFYHSFATVMGAQILISSVNTGLTAIFLFSVGFPHAMVLTCVTFLCGLLPILGNIISNSIITAVGFTLSPQMAGFALLFLMAIHKLEYFLNSKIIGSRIKNPMWLTLIGLLIGERLMGIPGMILAPVVLHYIKVEASQAKMEVPTLAAQAAQDELPT
jgi:predicted PurR-regulated permease PerM